jgi:CheY-like chemotaxis protein
MKGALKKILIAEDVPMNMLLAKMLVERSIPGLEILEAKNGEKALEIVFNEKPDLLLLDIQMPLVDGIAITEQIRNAKDTKIASIPIIAVTANALTIEKKRCLNAGANAFLTKPLIKKDLNKILKFYLLKSDDEINLSPEFSSRNSLDYFNYKDLIRRIGGNKLLMQQLLLTCFTEIENNINCLTNSHKYNSESIKNSSRNIYEISLNLSFPRLNSLITSIQYQILNELPLEKSSLDELKNEWKNTKVICQKILSQYSHQEH